jgi:two-component system CheB/CheR fusion protein
VDLKRRIFAKAARWIHRDRLLGMARTDGEEEINHRGDHARIRESALDTSPVAQVVVDFGGLLVLANERARALFKLAPADLGRPLQDLQLSYRPAELRSCIDRAYAERREIVLKDVEWSTGAGEASYFQVHVVPLIDTGGSLLGASVTFFDNTTTKRISDEHERATRELETAYEELQSTNEELETTNEELQSTNEELETTSEELQSTNEELETMNEELQSTNEELETVNEELGGRSEELKRVNIFLEAILGSLRGGVAVVDPEFLILIWNRKAEDLWGLRSDEVRGRNLLNLEIGLPVERLKSALRGCLSGEAAFQEITLDATNRRGKAILCRVTCTPMTDGHAISGVILVMDDETTPADGERAGRGDGATDGDGDGKSRRQPDATTSQLDSIDGD